MKNILILIVGLIAVSAFGQQTGGGQGAGGGGTPAGSPNAVQINNAGSFGGVAPPSTNCTWQFISQVTASASVAPTWGCPGITTNAQTGATYTLLTALADRSGYLDFSGQSTSTLTFCAITGTCANSLVFVVQNRNTANMTLTANAADSIDGGSLGGTSTLLPKYAAFVYSDATSAPGNWRTLKIPTAAAATGTGATYLSSTGTAPTASNVMIGDANGNAVPANALPAAVSAPPPTAPCSAIPTSVHVGTSDFTTTSASLVAVTGLAVTLNGSLACNYAFTCNLLFSESTGSTATGFGIQDVTTAPTQINAGITQQFSATSSFQGANITALNTTTATAFSTVTPTTTNVINAQITGFIEQPSGTASVFQIMGKIASAITLTVKRGSYCTFAQSN